MFIRFKKSGIPGITSKCAYCSLMTQTRLFFVSFQSQMMYFPGCWKEKIMPLPCQRNGELGCSLGLVHSNTIISGWWSNRINFKWKLTFRNVFVSVLLQRPRVLISLLPLLSYSSFSNISFFSQAPLCYTTGPPLISFSCLSMLHLDVEYEPTPLLSL